MLPAAPPADIAVELLEVLDAADSDRDARKARARAERAHRKAPEDPEARLLLAWVQLTTTEAPDCDATAALLAPLDGPWVPWQQAAQLHLARACGGPAWPERETAGRHLEADWDGPLAAMGPLYAHRSLGAHAPALHADLLEARATLSFARGEHEAAVSTLREALAIDASSDRRLRLGLSLMALEQEAEARAQLAVGLLTGEQQATLAERARISLDVLGKPSPPTTSPIAVGEPFPDLVLVGAEAPARLSDLSGPLVVDLWATWCEPCLLAQPHLAASAETWATQGVTLVGVNVDQYEGIYTHFLDRRDPGYLTAWVGPSAMADTGLGALPAVFVLDAEHRVMGFVGGWSAATARRVEALVDSVSDPSPPAGPE